MKRPLTLLITGVGAPGTKGTVHCLRNSHLPSLRLIGVDMRDHTGGRALVDAFYKLSNPEDPSYMEELAVICSKESVDLVIPQTTREISRLARDQEKIPVPVLVSSPDSIVLANHKGKLLKKFQEWNFPHPEFRIVKTKNEIKDAALELGYPLHPIVIKPSLSSGMRGFRIITEEKLSFERFIQEKPTGVEISLESLLELFETAPDKFEMILAEYLPGDEYSIDALINPQRSLAIARKRNQIRTGISFETTVEKQQELEEVVLAAGRELGLTHLFGMQFKQDSEGTFKLLECNPRIQGTMAATLTAGVNLIAYAVSDILGHNSPPLKLKVSTSPFFRYWGGAFEKEGTVHVF